MRAIGSTKELKKIMARDTVSYREAIYKAQQEFPVAAQSGIAFELDQFA
jgi:hypothetical protein